MKDVLVLVHDDVGQSGRLHAATTITQALQGHLTCLDITETPDHPFQTFGGPIANMVFQQAATAERHNKAAILPRLETAGVDFRWVDVAEDVTVALRRYGRLADLIVISTPLPHVEFPDMVPLARALVTTLHAPLLVTPPGIEAFDLSGAAIILWDGTPDADAALCAAAPLLKHAGQVTLLLVDEQSRSPSPASALDYLRGHDIIAHLSRHDAGGAHPDRIIDHYVAKHSPSWVVMGAFGQGKLREGLFGSLTTHMLATTKVPLLLAHQAGKAT